MRRISPFIRERITRFLREGLPGGAICERLGVTRDQLRREARKRGLKIKGSGLGLSSSTYLKLRGAKGAKFKVPMGEVHGSAKG